MIQIRGDRNDDDRPPQGTNKGNEWDLMVLSKTQLGIT